MDDTRLLVFSFGCTLGMLDRHSWLKYGGKKLRVMLLYSPGER